MARLEVLEWNWTYCPFIIVSYIVFAVVYSYIHSVSGYLCPTYKTLSNKTQISWHTYIYSLVHAIVMSLMSVYTLTDPEIWRDPIWFDSVPARVSCAICTGYMLFDFTVIIWHWRQLWDTFFFFHHLATVYAYVTVVGYGVLPFFAIYRLLAEISTPFVDLRWLIDTVGYPKTSPQNMINGVVMTLSFFIVRILAMPHYWYIVYTVYGTDDFNRIGHIRIVLLVSCVILDTINVFWFLKMCRGVKKVISLKLDANKNEIRSKED